MERQSLHEDLRRESDTKIGSERGFGLVFAGVLLLVALAPLVRQHQPRYWALGLAAAFLVAALAAPRSLRPLNQLWFRFGLVLHRIVSPLILGMLFFLTVTPVAFIYRLRGKDPLGLKFDRQRKSYWIVREPPGPPPDTMSKQF